jgi:PPOX class probable FMN-dependent enzyme
MSGTDLPAGYKQPPQVVWDKEIDHVDQHCRAFIALSPWATLATADVDGFPDVSPRGGEPGFVKVLDEHRLALPDRPGNNRVDSLRNVLVNPRVALMFVVPGIEETLRVFGAASFVADPAELDVDLTEFGRQPRSVLVIQVERAYFQCAKSLMRSGLWQPERWPGRGDFPSIGQVFRDHCELPAPLPPDEVMRADMATQL